ncbi:ComEC/Rec2 family competence protein [Prosthecomicrobium pneumaticum]|uniref:Competence protein ComEC n=1 Tax=Prosthecomicrobium pneumaticum TaxID=81895 RepID=A0A7W9CTE2_9HYPH|nr:ComEC/Rec2 family competence protein [Prosthecomicrobium pneumaticum]MBB5751306.1 competence protein ComEC [Prosthecomicrobium pneumaticum]
MEAGRGYLFLPVAFGLGILLYIGLPAEPSLFVLLPLTVGLGIAAAGLGARPAAFRLALFGAMVAAGASAMTIETRAMAAPRLDRERTVTVTGWVEHREPRRGGFRLTLRVASMEARGLGVIPRRVTLTLRGTAPYLGDAVTLKARLRPPSGLAMPGGYDYARAAFFAGIGATGFAYGKAKPATLGRAPLDIRSRAPLEAVREAMRDRILAVLPGEQGAIAVALTIGDMGGLTRETEDAMRLSGLAHVLSISGLHMVIVAGAAFFAVRALLALSPALALRYPIKKWAAGAALAVGLFYLLISGLGVATQRSFIMIAVVFVAVLLDRRGVSLRNVATAALIVMALAPDSLLSASFQMSFAATLALVAGYEALARRLLPRPEGVATGGLAGVSGRFGLWAGGMTLTSLLAGLATTPFGLHHFQRAAPLSVLANLAAMPVVDLLVMPAALVAALAMPFGLEALPLRLVGVGIDYMILVAHVVAELTGANAGAVAAPPVLALPLFVGGFLWLCLWRERWRLLGLVPIAASAIAFLLPQPPDILVSPAGDTVAIRAAEGRLVFLGKPPDGFVADTWLRADGDPRRHKAEDLAAGALCDPLGCTAPLPDGRLVALVRAAPAFEDDCRLAAVVVTPLAAPDWCSTTALVIDRAPLDRGGAQALVADGEGGFTIETAYPAARRPFMPPATAPR